MKDGCPFCDYEGPSEVLADFGDAFVIEPLRCITPGHVLVVPRRHVANFVSHPPTTGMVAAAAAEWCRQAGAANLITSKGKAATQTVGHFHVHVVPRFVGDGLKLPWAHPSGDNGAPVWMGETDAQPYACPCCGSLGTGALMADHIALDHSNAREALRRAQLPVLKATPLFDKKTFGGD